VLLLLLLGLRVLLLLLLLRGLGLRKGMVNLGLRRRGRRLLLSLDEVKRCVCDGS
jgi:hypothetical protein